MDLDVRQYLTKAKEHQDCGALQSAYVLIEGATSAGSSGRTPRIDPEWCVLCAETGLQLGCVEISTACLKMYFEGNPPANQFLCRAYLCQGQLKSPTATGSVKDFEEALMYFLKAIEISKREPRHHFMVFNASVLYFQTVRPLLQPGRSLHLVPSLRQVVQSLEEVADQDHSWRAELMMHLIKCLMDSRNVEDASSFAKVTEEFIKSHTPHLYPRLFTLLVQHQLSERGVLLETSRQSTALTVIYKMQELKKLEGLDKDKLTKENSAKLEEIFCLLVDRTKEPATPLNSRPLQSPAPIQPSDRVAFLLELALLALQVKHQKVAADCLKELKSSTEASVDQRIVMECVHCEINLLKKEAKMSEYSKASVEARLKEIRKLDQWLQTAVREGGPQAVQAVCATQWNFCLPLLQHNLRNRIKTPLLRVAQALEEMQSMLLELRCQVHSELAVTEEEKGRLEDSLTHLRKAMLLDNGTQQERLSSAFRLLKLRQTLYQTPSRVEDKAAMLMQQAKDMPPQNKTDFRPILVDVGIILAPDDFQLVLDADDTSKIPAGSLGSGPGARLAAKAQHHSASVQRVEGHMVRQRRDADHTEMMKLWATLAKTARKHEVWDVCRAACRFCLLYDDGRWQKTDTFSSSEGESCGSQSIVRLLRLLAEIHFISAEATIQKLREEGVQLNSPAVPPQGKWLCVSEEDPHWIIYRDWIQALCAYTTSSFLRAGELGAEIRESWVVVNAAIYLWNYNSHLLAAGEYIRLLPTFQSLVDMLQKTGYIGNRALFVLLCDAVAQGLIQPLSGLDNIVPAPVEDKGKKRAEKGIAKAASAHGVFLDPAPLQDLHKALEMCNDALHISNAAIPGETVPIAARKRVLATWVQINALLQQQIGSKIDKLKDESENEAMSAMTYVLAGVEMLQCNRNPRHMEFSVPNLSTLVSMAFQCRWSDAVVELQVWCQLAAFCHDVKDYSLVYSCTDRALQLEEAAAKTLNNMPCVLYGPTAVNEMLSIATCLRGLSLVHESSGDLDSYREAMKVLLSSLSYAEKAGSPALCVTAAKHYWNTCLPLTRSAEERRKLQKLLKMILNTLIPLATKQEEQQSKVKRPPILAKPPLGILKHEATNEDVLALKAAICCLWFQICIEEEDFERALQLLDKATRDMPHSRHRLPLLQYCVLVKARLGKNILLDIQKLEDEGEQCYSFLCHQAALCADAAAKQLTCYQKAITSLTSTETQWQKVNILLSFGQWLYSHNFNKEDAQQQIEWGIDILLHVEPEQAHGGADEPVERTLSPVKSEHLLGVQGLLFTQKVSSVKEMRRLDYLVQAHTLLAIMGDKTSPEHQLNLLRAYTFVLQMWQVSMAVACEISREMAKSEALHPPTSAESKKGKDRGKGKKEKEPIPAEERRKPVILDQTPPSTLRDWARFVCPDQARQIFRTSSNPHCINTLSITKQKQSLFYLSLLEKELHLLSLDHLTLPVMHLAETIAHDLLDSRSLSDLYRLRIVRTCVQLGLEAHSPYQKKLLTLSAVPEREQMGCHRAIVLSKERCSLRRACNQKGDMDESTLHIWLDKAEVCLSMGLYQSARQLLAEAHMVSMVLGDQNAKSRSLLYLASLACKEQNHAQALILLDKAHALGGDEHFWYQFTLTKVAAVVGQRDKDSQTKVDHIIKQGCEALKLVLDQRVNRAPELTFLITSLEKRGALECIRAIGSGKPLVTLDSEAFQRLMAACDTLRECASGFTKFGYRQQAAEAHGECAQGLRILASHTTERESKQRFLLNGLSQMQLAITVQEHVVLNAQSLLPPQEERHGPSLAATRRLLRLRLALAEFCLHVLEERCAEETQQAVARQKKTSAEIALEEFSRCTPEPNSTEEEWMTVGITLQEIALGQLAAVSSRSLDNVETRACCLNLMGKYMRLVAVLEDPIYVYSLQKTNKQKEAWSDSKVVSMEEEDSEKDGRSSRKKLQMTSAKSSELQKSQKVQQLLAQATKPLAEATNLCLHHNVSPSILAGASLNMVECLGQSDPAVAGQYLALFQSCCTVAVIAEVLGSACADTSLSQLSALLSIRRNLLLSHEERPSSMIKGVEDSLSSLSKTFSHLTVNPSHLSILGELPPTLKILLLQHTEDGSELYGAFYEATKTQKGKTTQVTGSLMCTRVAKVSVCPQALLALREQTRAFCQETRHALPNKDSRRGAEDRLEASEEHPVFSHKSAREEELAGRFRDLVKDMEDYLNPLLTKFDFSCLRTNAGSLPVPETEKTKEKEERGSSGQVKMPTDPGEYVVVLADRNLLELPLESLSILQEEGLRSVTRDFSLQLLYSRLRKDKQKVESDNKKETKGGKGTKAKGDQSQAIKAVPASHVLPSNTFPLDTNNFKYLVDPYNEGHFGQTSLSMKMKEILETHSQHLTHPWEGFMGSKQIPSLSEMEQMLRRCSGFLYLGVEHFMANVPPAKLAALSLFECRLALLFDQGYNKTNVLHQSKPDMQQSAGTFALENPYETALLLSLCGVGCVVLNQWHSSFHQNIHNVTAVLDNMLRIRQTSGKAVHALRKGDNSKIPHHKVKGSHDQELLSDLNEGKEDDDHGKMALTPSAFNCVLYGLPNLILM